MKKKTVAAAIAFVLAAGILAGCGNASVSSQPAASDAAKASTQDAGSTPANAEYTLICASTYNEDYHYYKAMKAMEKEIEEKSGGRIDVQVYASGSIAADDRESLEMLTRNEIQFGMGENSVIAAVYNDPRIGASTIPFFLGDDNEKIYKLLDEGEAYNELYKEMDEKYRLHVVCSVSTDEAVAINRIRPCASVADFKGLKIRTVTADDYAKPMALIGANPTTLSWGEVYTSLQQGVIDGCFSTKSGMYSMGFYEICKYCTDLNVFDMMHTYCYSSDFYDSLPEDLQKVLDEAGENFKVYVRGLAQEYIDDIPARLEEDGVEVIELDDAFKADLEASYADYIQQRRGAIPEFVEKIEKDIEKLW